MILGDLNLFFLFFFLLIFSIIININTSLHLLLTAEILWITLYIIILIVSFVFDNLNLVSLTFFFLVFSAIEFGVGLLLLLFQNIFMRSLNLNNFDLNFIKFLNRYKNNLFINKIKWKF